MRKYLFCLTTIFILPLFVAGQLGFEQLEKEIVKKLSIKSKEQWDYGYTSKGEVSSRGYQSSKTTYDHFGNIIEVVNMKRGGDTLNILAYQYDRQGNRLSYVKYDNGKREKITYMQKFTYDSKGNKLLETGFNGADNYNNIYKYSSTGDLLEIKYYVGKRLDQRRVFEYSGNSTQINVFDGNDKLMFRLENKYNDMGKIVIEQRLEKDNSVSKKTEIKYHNDGKISETEKQQFGKIVNVIEYIYEPNGQLRAIYEQENDSPRYLKYSYTYSDNGRIEHEKWRNGPDASFSTKDYKYDNQGKVETIDCFFATYKYKVLYRFNYDFYKP
ncbi:MAG: hypothetical protein ACLFUC_04585 [Bacteroidales bacterium]